MNLYWTNYMCQIKNLNDIYLETFGYITSGFFVDVGAFDGRQWSNTYNLALAGWSGIAVEPHPEHYNKLLSLYSDNPKIAPVRAAITNFIGHVELYLGGSLTTTKAKTVELYNNTNWGKFSGLSLDNKITVPAMKLDTLLETFRVSSEFQVLSIDVEGAEIDVLKGFSIDYYRPALIIVETHEKNDDRRLARKSRYVNAYMKKHGYLNIQADSINSIYRKADV